jgi:hypothetical protein
MQAVEAAMGGGRGGVWREQQWSLWIAESGGGRCGLERLWDPLRPISEAPCNWGFPPDFRSHLLSGFDWRHALRGMR